MNITEIIQEILQNEERINSVFLHGSFGTSRQNEKSDLDIAVLLRDGEKLGTMDRMELIEKLEQGCKMEVDLGVMSADSLIYTVQAIDAGKILFVKDQFQHDLKIATFLAQYAQLKEDRIEVEKAYAI